MKKRAIVAICASAPALFVTPTAADAESTQVFCTSAGYTGYNKVIYKSIGGGKWAVTDTQYNFKPASSSSVKNNQIFNIHSGSSSSGNIYSADNLVRDGQWHYNTRNGYYATLRGSTYVYFYDIFDVPQVNDPECGVNTVKF